MIPEDLMKKYKYGYVHSCNLLTEPFIKDLLNENEKLKKQLEEYKRLGFKHLQDKNNELENQQQEFITYLTSYIELLNNKPDLVEESQIDILEEILQKYKEIIGETNDKK